MIPYYAIQAGLEQQQIPFIQTVKNGRHPLEHALAFGNPYPSENNMNIEFPYLPGCLLPSVLALQSVGLVWSGLAGRYETQWMHFWHMLNERSPFFHSILTHGTHIATACQRERCTNKPTQKKHSWHVPLEPGFLPWNSRSSSHLSWGSTPRQRRFEVGWNHTGMIVGWLPRSLPAGAEMEHVTWARPITYAFWGLLMLLTFH